VGNTGSHHTRRSRPRRPTTASATQYTRPRLFACGFAVKCAIRECHGDVPDTQPNMVEHRAHLHGIFGLQTSLQNQIQTTMSSISKPTGNIQRSPYMRAGIGASTSRGLGGELLSETVYIYIYIHVYLYVYIHIVFGA
jgi:hypothetical protein